MSEPVLVALIGAGSALLVGLFTLLGTRFVARVQAKAAENEKRLRQFEEWDSLLSNLRTDLDRARADCNRIRIERDDWMGRAVRAEHQLEKGT